MDSRLTIQAKLEEFLGSEEVYCQPPDASAMIYPCIIYNKKSVDKLYSNNKIYKCSKSYEVTIIQNDPDSDLPDRMIEYFPFTKFDRHFTKDNLDHDVFVVYF